jgi:uncharacterized protein (TIGR03435 family)
MPPGRFTATNIPLKVLITNAYQLSFFQVIGGPEWVSTDRFDIAAKAPDGAPPDQTRAMVRTLLRIASSSWCTWRRATRRSTRW